MNIPDYDMPSLKANLPNSLYPSDCKDILYKCTNYIHKVFLAADQPMLPNRPDFNLLTYIVYFPETLLVLDSKTCDIVENYACLITCAKNCSTINQAKC
jgi:hypothetical protein